VEEKVSNSHLNAHSTVGGLLLAAGRGVRLRPLTDVTPKPALDVCGVPLGAWGLTVLRRAGLSVAVNVSHLGHLVEVALRPFDPELEILDEGRKPFGTAGTLREFRRMFGPRVVTYNADLLSALDVSELLESHLRIGASMTVAVQRVSWGADLVTTGEHAVGFVDRRSEPERGGARFLGIAVVEQDAINMIPPDGARGIGECLLRPLAERRELAVVVHEGYALDVGTHDRLEEARRAVRDGLIAMPLRRT
jgi:NDP-sugar pyrophosphorylase family protein